MNKPPPMVADIFRRFTDRSRTAVVKSESFARREGSATVDPRHLLLGVIAADGTARAALGAQQELASLDQLATIDDVAFAHLPHVPYLSDSKKVLEHALIVAIAADDIEIRTEHLLAALIDIEDQDVRRMLAAHRLEVSVLRLLLPAPDAEARAVARQTMTKHVAPP